MTTFLSLWGFLLCLLSGWLAMALALETVLELLAANVQGGRRAKFCLQSCLALAAALGWCSAFSFLYFAGVSLTITLLLQVALSFVLVLLQARRRVQRRSIEYSIDRTASQAASTNAEKAGLLVSSKPRWLLPSFVLLYGVAALMLLVLTIQQPHGSWDAWAIWNLHARFFFRGGMDWTAYRAPPIAWTHADYPLLIPLCVARGWSIIGHETTVIPAALAFFFTLGTGVLLASALWLLRGPVQAFAASLMLLSAPFLLVDGAGQCADVPLGFFFLATAVCFALHDRATQQNQTTTVSLTQTSTTQEPGTSFQGASSQGAIFVAGSMAGAAAWTKNEGLLFLVVAVVVRLLVMRLLVVGRAAKARTAPSQLMAFVGGALPFLVAIALFKHFYAPPSDLAGGQDASILSKIGDPARYATIFAAFFHEMWNFNVWFYPPIVVLLPYAWLMGLRRGVFRRPVAIEYSTAAGLVALMLLGYFFIYLSTPRELAWHLKTSLARLLLQLWPMVVFVFFLMARTPQEALSATSSEEEQSAGFIATP